MHAAVHALGSGRILKSKKNLSCWKASIDGFKTKRIRTSPPVYLIDNMHCHTEYDRFDEGITWFDELTITIGTNKKTKRRITRKNIIFFHVFSCSLSVFFSRFCSLHLVVVINAQHFQLGHKKSNINSEQNVFMPTKLINIITANDYLREFKTSSW